MLVITYLFHSQQLTPNFEVGVLRRRWDWRVFRLSGSEMSRGERFNLHAEVQKLKELVLPPRARDIYTGRGIRLPQ